MRKWLAFKKQGERKSWGDAVARRYWPGRSKKRDLLRCAFRYAASHLACVKDLADYLVDRDRPRVLARALVNHLLRQDGDAKYFSKAPEAARKLVAELCASDQLSEAMKSLYRLAASTVTAGERKDAPATRLKHALEAQFRLWRADGCSSGQHFAQDAVGLVPPWQMERMTAKRGDVKVLASQLCELVARRGPKPSLESMERHIRAYGHRSAAV